MTKSINEAKVEHRSLRGAEKFFGVLEGGGDDMARTKRGLPPSGCFVGEAVRSHYHHHRRQMSLRILRQGKLIVEELQKIVYNCIYTKSAKFCGFRG